MEDGGFLDCVTVTYRSSDTDFVLVSSKGRGGGLLGGGSKGSRGSDKGGKDGELHGGLEYELSRYCNLVAGTGPRTKPAGILVGTKTSILKIFKNSSGKIHSTFHVLPRQFVVNRY